MRARDRISASLGGAALVVSVLVIGGSLRWTQALVAVLIGLALSLQLFGRRHLVRVSPLVLLILVALGLSALQLVPLPAGLREVLTPVGERLRAEGAQLAGTSPWPSLSLDTAGTLRAVAFFTILLGFAALGLRFSAAERSRFAVLSAVAGTCGLAAVVTGIHTLVNADTLYGLYAPAHATPPVLGPLLNGNHLGCLMAFGTALSVGLAFYQRQPTKLRVTWVVNAIGCAIVAFASLSRGAVVALVIGLIVIGVLHLAPRLAASSRGHDRRRSLFTNELPLGIVIVIGLGVAVFTSAGKVADQLDNTSVAELSRPTSKYAAWRSATSLALENPIAGIGRGAFEPVFTRVHPASAYVTFSHAENEYLQAVVDWGLLGAALLGVAFAWCIVTAARRWRDGPLAIAALGAMAVVGFQSCVDFGVEMLGVAVPVTLVGSTLLVVPFREGSSPARTRVLRGAMLGGLACAALLLLLPATTSLQEDHDRLLASANPTLADLQATIERHPLDYLGFVQAAMLHGERKDTRAVQLLNHALVLHPTHPGMHRLAARMLVRAGRAKQAALEFALAMSGTPSPFHLLEEIVAYLPDAEEAALAIPADYDNVDLVLRSLDELNRDDIALAWLVRVTARPQKTPNLLDRAYDLAVRRHDLDLAKHLAEARLAVARTTTSRLMLAKILFLQHDYDGVLAQLSDVATWTGRIDEQGEAWGLVCDVRIERHEWDPALQCVHRLDASGIVASTRREDVTKRITRINDARTHEARQQLIENMEKSLQSSPK